MIDRLPGRLDLLATASAGRKLRGGMPVASLERVLPALQDSSGELAVTLELGREPEGPSYLAGTISGTVLQQCQRCLENLPVELEISFRLGLVRSQEEAARLSARYEPLLVTSEPAELAEIISDEVLLALPLVPLHVDDSNCHAFVRDYRPPEPERSDNPFAVLADMKQKHQ